MQEVFQLRIVKRGLWCTVSPGAMRGLLSASGADPFPRQDFWFSSGTWSY